MMGGVTESEEGIVRVATKFAKEGIILHIDARFTPMHRGCICILGSKLPADRGGMGGGEVTLHIDDVCLQKIKHLQFCSRIKFLG